LDIDIGVSISNLGEIQKCHAIWSEDSEILIELQGAFELLVRADVTPTMKVGGKVYYDKKELISKPIKGIELPDKVQDALGKIAKKLKVKLPEMKVGLFAELMLVWDVFAEIKKNFGTIADFSYNTGRYEANLSIHGNKWLPSVDSSLDKVADPSFAMDLSPPDLDFRPDELTVEAFLGVRPQLIAYLTDILTARISVDSGYSVTAWATLFDNAFAPVSASNGSPNGKIYGWKDTCLECHALQLQYAKTTKNAGFFLTLGWKFQLDSLKKAGSTTDDPKYWWEPKRSYVLYQLTLPGNPSWHEVLGTSCFNVVEESQLVNGACTDKLELNDEFTCVDWCKLIDECLVTSDCDNKGPIAYTICR